MNHTTALSPHLTKKDLIFAGINGSLFGILLPYVLRNLEINLNIDRLLYIAFFALLSIIGVAIGFFLARVARFFSQLAKFGIVGAANTAIDFGILNLLIFFTGAAAGVPFVVFKAISFSVAIINSYIWNKYWTFGKKNTTEVKSEFAQFLIISLIGILLNTGIASFINNGIGPLGAIDPQKWANISAAFATISVLMWNFLGYKFFVFKK